MLPPIRTMMQNADDVNCGAQRIHRLQRFHRPSHHGALAPIHCIVYDCLPNHPRSVLGCVLKACEAVVAVTTDHAGDPHHVLQREGARQSGRRHDNRGRSSGLCRMAYSKPLSSLAVLETAFWKTLGYFVLWWGLAVYRCKNMEEKNISSSFE